MKKVTDDQRRAVQFEEKDLVFLKLQPYPQKSLDKYVNEQLSPSFFGPYPILQKIGTVAYKLHLLDMANTHLVFHVSQLSKVVGPI